MNEPILFRDAIENLVDYIQGGSQDSEQRLFKRVIREAYREFFEAQPWTYFETECTLLLPQYGPTVRLRYDHATNRLLSSFSIISATATSPVVVGLVPEFAARDGERIWVKNIDGTTSDDYEIDYVSGNQWTLLGSTSTGGGEEATGGDDASWIGGEDAVWLDGTNAVWMGFGESSGLEGDEIAWRFTFKEEHVGSRVQLNGISYPIIDFIDDQTVQLAPNSNPGMTIAGADFVFQPQSMLLPADFYKMGWVTESNSCRWSECFLDPDSWLGMEQSCAGLSNIPFRWTIMPSRHAEGRWEIRWIGNPGANRRISFIYLRRPVDDLRWSGTEPGASSTGGAKIATTAGSRTVTGTGTSFSQAMVGAWIRIGRRKVNPNSIPSGLDGNDPYMELHQIRSVQSATSLTLTKAAKYTDTDLSFMVSSRLDLAQEHLNAFYACTQKLLAFKTQDDDRIQASIARYRETLRLAMEGDYKVRFHRSASNTFEVPSIYGHPRDSDFGPSAPTPFG